jgi:LacI family transcriptional regulator
MKMGYNVMVCHSNEQYDTEIKNVEALLNANVEGIIISVARDTEKNEHIKKLKRKGIPWSCLTGSLKILRHRRWL